MRRFVLFRWGLGLIGLGVAIMALPASIEGPVLVDISPGHAVATVDAIGLVPLVVGVALLLWGYGCSGVDSVSGCLTGQRAGSPVSSSPAWVWACWWLPLSPTFSGGGLLARCSSQAPS